MVFRKYKPVSQWGKQDTRIFKAILNARNARKMPVFRIPDAVKALGVKVHDPTSPGFFDSESVRQIEKEHHSFAQNDITLHPLYIDTPCRLFEGGEPMSDGVDQACVISKAVLRTEFPEEVMKNSLDEIDADKIRDAILHGERYDPTLEKLPRRFDPVLFWVKHPRVHGTPVIKRGNIILDNLFRHIILTAIGREKIKATQIKLNRDEPFSATINSAPCFTQSPLVIRGQPHLTSLSAAQSKPWATKDEVDATSNESIASIAPLSPLIDFSSDHIYNKDSVVARPTESSLSLHSLAWTREQSQKYPWTTEQNAANAVLYTFGAAVAEARRRGEKSLSTSPVVSRGVQLVDGRLDLVAVQLNTLDLSENEQKKNIVWLQKGLRLYKPKPYFEQMEEVADLNVDAVRKLSALFLS
ncbi:hypothetical protein PFISCL1PPCAC_8031 [Pristionchus fissidentatus]|uniref:Ribosomal protein n=1 Tax=Pristionchus fissidentatus TaxID=1538716 RepID=A0AAV5VFT9_9BILA|nr:hypothetical protein PFISCL1PPCAC_8031 [Pristionchus fissidentatus]